VLRRRSALLLVLAGIALPAVGVLAESGDFSASEVGLKAAVLLKITKFVDWPSGRFDSATSPFAVAVVGDDPLGAALEPFLKDTRVADHPVVVTRFSRGDRLPKSHLIYIGDSEARRLEEIVTQAEECGALTVGTFSQFTERGGMFHLFAQNGRVRFAINNRSAHRAGLKISSKLLSLANAVITD
jgi:hypothetical protein